ncbi:MAG: DUF2946 domain-containing protein [Massilia sp.]
MHRLAKTKVLHAWIALLAFLFGVLAPTVSHALAASAAQAQPAEICTSAGIQSLVHASGHDVEQSSDSILHGFKHCEFCGIHAGSFAFPSPPMLVFAVLDGHDLFPSLFYQSPSPLFAWTVANSRAPPAALA